MKNPYNAIQQAYYTALNNTITVGNVDYPFYDIAPTGSNYNYIYLNGMDSDNDDDKDTISTRVTVTLEVVCGVKGHLGGFNVCNQVISGILQAVIVKGGGFSNLPPTGSAEFRMIKSTLLGQTRFPVEETKTERIFRMAVQIEHFIEEV